MPFPFLAAAGVASSIIGSIFKGSQAKKQQRMADAIHPVDGTYQDSPYAKSQLATVQQMMNGRMAGAGVAEDKIQANLANSMAGVDRNSSNGAQSLAMLAGLQGNTDSAISDLQTKEAMNKYNMLGQLAYANQGMTLEGDKRFNDTIRKFNNDTSAKNALQNASWQNKGGMWDGISNALIGAGNAADQYQKNKGGGASSSFGGASGGTMATPFQSQSFVPQVSGGSYMDPNMAMPQRNFVNPFINR